MKFVLLSFYLILQTCLIMACSSKEEKLASGLEVGKEAVDFANTAGAKLVDVVASDPSWSAKSDKSWCHPSPNGKQLKINVDESDERLVREAIITVESDGLSKTIKVRQLGYEAAILIDKQRFEMPAVGGEVKFSVTTNVDVKITLPDWIKEKPKPRAVAMVTTEYSYQVSQSVSDAKREGAIEVVEVLPAGATEDKTPVKSIVTVSQHGLNEYIGGNGEDIADDIKIQVKSGSASSYHEGEGIDKSFDGDYNTLYHSNWNNAGTNYFPITLTYNFEKAEDVDYLVYYPRTSGANGNFKEVDIFYSEDGDSFSKLTEKDFKGSSSATKVIFDRQIHAKSIRLVVNSGAGDGQGFASCAEMEFYAKNPERFRYETLFTDETCSELKNGITQADIDACQFPFFKNLAYYMLQGKYKTEFRIATYKAYPHPDIQSGTNKTNPYSLLDNATGISVKANENLIVMVGDTHGYSISLKVQNLDVPEGDGFGGRTYPLNQGINKIAIAEKGLVYVMYHTDDLDDPSALPVKIHFASGTVNGYYDSQKHAGRWNELLNNATDKYFDVLGKYAHLTFETADFKKYAGTTGDKLIEAYDEMVLNEALLLGLEKYDRMFKNRMYLNVMYHSYMYATSYHTGYHQGTMSEICNPAKLTTGGCWGPAHEIGHCNQTRPGVLWIGNTEVTNNIMSEYIQTTIFNQPSRIQDEDMGIVFRNRYSKAWTGIIAGKRPHCDFEVLGDKNDVFCKLVPFWQLELYMGKVLEKTPLKQSDKGGFYPDVYEYAREKDYKGMTNGEIQLDFVYNCCKAARMNLLNFFEKWGFLTPVDKLIEDYDKQTLAVTQAMADAMRAKVNALGYPRPDVALEYISDNTVELYRNKPAIVKGADATHSPKTFTSGDKTYNGDAITISNWKNVAVYEVADANGKVFFICSGENSPSATDSFTIPVRWESGFKLYAVSATGERVGIEMK